jgi:hypothetical protein
VLLHRRYSHRERGVPGEGDRGLVEHRIFEDPQDVPVKIEAHQLGDGKGNRQVELVPLYETEPALLAVFFRVEGKTGLLDAGQVPPDGACLAAFLLGQVSHGDAVPVGFQRPQNTPLPGKLFASHVIILSLQAFPQGPKRRL